MPAPLSVKRNPYTANPKRSDIYTPPAVSNFLFHLLENHPYQNILDPAIGLGSLTNPWRRSGAFIQGVDINPESADYADCFIQSRFEDIDEWPCLNPDLILCNPPFNSAQGK